MRPSGLIPTNPKTVANLRNLASLCKPTGTILAQFFWTGVRDMKGFMSYSSIDKEMAGVLKVELGEFGIDAFLAHQDIRPTRKWRKVILFELQACEVFLALITKNFDRSDWTDQETGFVLARKVPIVAIAVGKSRPHGFLEEEQAFILTADNVEQAAWEIAKIIGEQPSLAERFLDGLISSYAASESYDESNERTPRLLEMSAFTAKQAERVLKAAIENSQINWGKVACPALRKFASRYSPILAPSLIKAVEKKLRW